VFRRLSVANNIMAILETKAALDGAQRVERLEELLEELHIEHVRDSLGLSLSGGERRRVEIARPLRQNRSSCSWTSRLPVSIRCPWPISNG